MADGDDDGGYVQLRAFRCALAIYRLEFIHKLILIALAVNIK